MERQLFYYLLTGSKPLMRGSISCQSARRVQLSSESIVKIDLPGFLSKEDKIYFLVVVAIAREMIWKTRVKGLKTGCFDSGSALINLFTSHLNRENRVGAKMPVSENAPQSMEERSTDVEIEYNHMYAAYNVSQASVVRQKLWRSEVNTSLIPSVMSSGLLYHSIYIFGKFLNHYVLSLVCLTTTPIPTPTLYQIVLSFLRWPLVGNKRKSTYS